MIRTVELAPEEKQEPEMVAPANSGNVSIKSDGQRTTMTVDIDDTNPNADIPPEPAPVEDPARPAWLPEKFKGAEDLAKAYTELEKAYHNKGKAPEPTEVPPATPPATLETPAAVEAPKGIDMAAISKEYADNDGSLSDETYTDLAARGFDRATVDTVIAGQQAIAAGIKTEIASVAGGEAKLAQVLEWAGKNLAADQVEAYQAALGTNNKGLVKLALGGIVAAHAAAVVSEPSLVKGEPGAGSDNAEGFRSNAEMVAAMQSPKYAKDPAYRADVAKRIAKSGRLL